MSQTELLTQITSLLQSAGLLPANGAIQTQPVQTAVPAKMTKAESAAKARASKAAKRQTATTEAVIMADEPKAAPVVKLSETLRHLYLAALAISDLNESDANPNVRFRNPAVWIWQIRDLGRAVDGGSPADPMIAKLDADGQLQPSLDALCKAGALVQHVSRNGKLFYSPAVKGYDPSVRRTTVKTDSRDNERRSAILRRMASYSSR